MFCLPFLASKDAQEVMGVTHSVSESELADLTDATLVSEDTDEDGEDDEDDFAPSHIVESTRIETFSPRIM